MIRRGSRSRISCWGRMRDKVVREVCCERPPAVLHPSFPRKRIPGDLRHGVGSRATTLGSRFQIGRAPSELQSLMRISYAVFCLKKQTKQTTKNNKTEIQHN